MQSSSASQIPAGPITPMARYRREILWLLGLGLLVLLAFWPVLEADFLAWDDDINIYENTHIQGLNAENLKWMFTDFEHALRYKPLSWLSWAVIHEFSELHPFGYHFANLFFHLVNTALVFLLFRQLSLIALGEKSEGVRDATLFAVGAGTAFWALHPLRVESVAWATALPYGQALGFLLASLLCYVRRVTTGKLKWYWFSVVLFACSLLTYPTVLGAVGIFIALDFWPLKTATWPKIARLQNPESRHVLLEKVPYVLLTVIFLAGTVMGRVNQTGDWPVPQTLDEFGLGARVMQAFYVWGYFFWKPIVPLDLSPVYTTFIYFRPFDAAFVLSMVAVLGITGGVIASARRRPLIAVVWFCHLAVLVPVLGLTERPHYHHDRYSLIAGIAWAGLVAAAVQVMLVRGRARLVYGLTAALAVTFAAMSQRQAKIWDNDVVFMEDMVAKLSDSAYRSTAFLKLGNVYAEAEAFDKAEHAFRESIRLNPNFAKPNFNLANLLAGKGKFAEAVPLYHEAIRLDPKHIGARNNLAIVLIQLGRLPEAEKALREAVAIVPDNADSHFNLAEVLQRQGKTAEAAEHSRTAERLKSGGR